LERKREGGGFGEGVLPSRGREEGEFGKGVLSSKEGEGFGREYPPPRKGGLRREKRKRLLTYLNIENYLFLHRPPKFHPLRRKP